MAATDQFYRNQKTLNRVFAASSVIMFLSIMWMLVDDYRKPYKEVQRDFRDIEEQVALRAMLQRMPNTKEVEAARARLNQVKKERDDFLKKQSEDGDYRKLLARKEKQQAVAAEIKAFYVSKVSERDLEIEKIAQARTDAEKAQIRARTDAFQKEADELKVRLDKAEAELTATVKELEQADEPLKKLEDRVSEAEDALKRITAAFDRFAKLTAEKRWKTGDTVRNLPILDSFAPPTKVHQIVLNDLTIDYGGFRDVPRYDRCVSCHLGIDKPAYDRKALIELGNRRTAFDLEQHLKEAKRLFEQRKKDGEALGFDPADLPDRVKVMDLTDVQVAQYAAHPRLDLFVDGNSPHSAEKFGCTICHNGQGSATDFNLASHTPNDAVQRKRWATAPKDDGGHHWHANHYWDFPMLPKRFVESTCLKCHHQVTDMVRYGSKEEAPKVTRGYNLVRELGCYGCHEIPGHKGGRPVGPDLRLEPTPPIEWLTTAEQTRLRNDTANPPGTLRKVGPSLRRLADKTSDEWVRKWLRDPRGYRPDTRMPHFYGLSTNSKEALPADQKDFPEAEIYAITAYLMAESNRTLKGGDTTYAAVLQALKERQARFLQGSADRGKPNFWSDKDTKAVNELTTRLRDLALMANPMNRDRINASYETLTRLNMQIQAAIVEGGKPETFKASLEEAMKALTAAAVPGSATYEAKFVVDGAGLAHDVKQIPALPAADAKTYFSTGRSLFIEKGCLACHAHEATGAGGRYARAGSEAGFEQVTSDADFGPNLTGLSFKLGVKDKPESARLWLIQWILNPNFHHPRTRMPVTHLSLSEATTIADWLLRDADLKAHPTREAEQNNEPRPPIFDFQTPDVPTPKRETLVELARLTLAKVPSIGKANVDEVLNKGFSKKFQPPNMPFDADELLLVAPANPEREAPIETDRLARYVGKKAIGRLGCYACHDIPGFEAAKPIGTQLHDWGKKDGERLAFEDAYSFAKAHFNIVDQRDNPETGAPAADWKVKDGKRPFESIFLDAIKGHAREGFLHLKLFEPRSYDYERVRTWDDRLRMPQFRFSRLRRRPDEKPVPGDSRADSVAKQERYLARRQVEARGQLDPLAEQSEAKAREAVMTFILGLVADPVPLKYVHNPNGEKKAEARGRQVLEKYNCIGCHQVRQGVYEFQIPELRGRESLIDPIKSLLMDHPSDVFPESSAWSARPSPVQGRLFVHGLERPIDPKDDPRNRSIRLWLTEAVAIHDDRGTTINRPAGQLLTLPRSRLVSAAPVYGGNFVSTVFPYVQNNNNERLSASPGVRAKEEMVYASLPPELLRQGERTQPEWLFGFLLNPIKMRPYTILRMPRFNLSEDEARSLVEYFSAAAKINNPGTQLTGSFQSAPEKDQGYWLQRNREYMQILSKEPAKLQLRENVLKETLKTHYTQEKIDLERRIKEIESLLKASPDKDVPKFLEALKQVELPALQQRLKVVEDRLKDGKFTEDVASWRHKDAYFLDAYLQLTRADSCLQCHSIGPLRVAGEQGPNLGLAASRLRPDWMMRWIANPPRMTTHVPVMLRVFEHGKPVRIDTGPFKGLGLEGDARFQVQAIRDVLVNLPSVTDLPATRYRVIPQK